MPLRGGEKFANQSEGVNCVLLKISFQTNKSNRNKYEIIVTGGREYCNTEKVRSVLEHFNPDVIVHGDCRGLDRICKQWALDNGKVQIPYPYPSQHGKAGGPIRNRQMCTEHKDADLLIAFQGNNGTENCVREATSAGIKVFRVVE